jgi:integrase
MSVRVRGSSWQADFSFKGERYRKQDFGSQAEAEAWEHDTRARLLRGEPIAPGASSEEVPKTLRQLADRVFNLKWKGTKNEKGAQINLDACVDALGPDRPVNSIGEPEIDHLVAEFKRQGNANGTINRKLSALSKTLKYAARQRWINRMPIFERQKEHEGRLRWLTPHEEQQLLAKLDWMGWESFKDLVCILIDQGTRLGEALGVRWKDVEERQGTLWINIPDSKNGKGRALPCTERVEQILKRRKQLHAENELVFHDVGYWSAQHNWDTVRTHLKMDDDPQYVMHMLRHTFCSRLAQRGVPLLTIQKLAGHKTIQMTMRYSHLAPENLVEVMRTNPLASTVPSQRHSLSQTA